MELLATGNSICCPDLLYVMLFYSSLYINIYIYIYIYIYKEFCVGGSKAKTVLYFSYSTARCELAILSVYRIGYAYAKEPEGFQKVFLSPFSAG